MIANSSSASRYCASDLAQYSPSGVAPRWLSTRWKGPAASPITYGGSGMVGGKPHQRHSSVGSNSSGCPGSVETTTQSSGTRNRKRKEPLRSGWSKQGKHRWAS